MTSLNISIAALAAKLSDIDNQITMHKSVMEKHIKHGEYSTAQYQYADYELSKLSALREPIYRQWCEYRLEAAYGFTHCISEKPATVNTDAAVEIV